jgi:hypothetical protein
MDLRKSREATEQRHERDNRPRTAKGRRRRFLETPIGQKYAEPALGEIVDFLDGKLAQKPDPKPEWLDAFISDAKLPTEELALTILAPILDRVHRGWSEDPDKSPKAKLLRRNSRAMLLEKELSETLRDHLARRQALINIKGELRPWLKIRRSVQRKNGAIWNAS